MVHPSWFDNLRMIGLREHHSWPTNLSSRVNRVANFGCWSGSEPFALMWTLDACEVTVIEIEKKYTEDLNEQIEIVKMTCPESLQGREVEFLLRDMTLPIQELPDRYFDLAYCEDVLYTLPLQGESGALECGLQQMIRLVKLGGFIIAVEPKFDVKFQTRKLEDLGLNISLPIRISEPKDISFLFSSNGLKRIKLLSSPPYSYCYQKIT